MERKIHFIWNWDGITACGRDSLVQDLNQTTYRGLITCKKCLAHFKKERKRKIKDDLPQESQPQPPSASGP